MGCRQDGQWVIILGWTNGAQVQFDAFFHFANDMHLTGFAVEFEDQLFVPID